ncbi:hypothetical protein AAVH_12153 [Aphelenchoides avenae]|nr:hypothetical protein AAVH_12153 [Aphelenchus avenae]
MESASEICEIARPFASDIWLSIGQVVQITLCLVTLVLAPFSLSKRKWRKVPVHINLKILFINVLILYVIILYRTFSDPCDLLTPSWVSVVVRGPMNTYIVGFPLWHLAITLERSWATYRADAYEKSSSRYGVFAAATVVSTLRTKFALVHRC